MTWPRGIAPPSLHYALIGELSLYKNERRPWPIRSPPGRRDSKARTAIAAEFTPLAMIRAEIRGYPGQLLLQKAVDSRDRSKTSCQGKP